MPVDDFRTAYPEELETAERKLLCCSPKWKEALAGVDPAARHERIDRSKLAGVGLSGGGIRSATFALGVFQGLARLGLLKRIDYLSTVSGGGYFGSFFGRLFTRPYVRGIEDVEEVLTLPGQGSPRRGTAEDRAIKTSVFPWLRENGRYLSPNGSGDLLAAGAALFRNWVAVQTVLLTLVLFFFLLAQLPRAWAEASLASPRFWFEFHRPFHWEMPFGLQLWGSPYVFLAAAVFLLWAFPLGWAYWMVRTDDRRVLRVQIHPVVGLVLAAVLGIAAVGLAQQDEEWSLRLTALVAVSALIAVAALLTLVCWWRSQAKARAEWKQERERRGLAEGVETAAAAEAEREGERPGDPEERHEMGDTHAKIFKSSYARHWLTGRLKLALMASSLVVLFVVVDSLGQTVYTVLLDPDSSFRAWAAGIGAALLAVTGFARKIAVLMGDKGGDKRPPGWSTALATAAAFALMLFVLTAVGAASHAVAWRCDPPAYAPEGLGRTPPRPLIEAAVLAARPVDGGWVIAREGEEGREAPAAGGAEEGAPDEIALRMRRHLGTLAWGCGVTLAFSLLFGRSWAFLNRSTQLPLYSARLIRAYLGASNPWRHKNGGKPVTQVIPGDDLHVERYWPTACDPRTDVWCDRGAPLHLINVTVNETVDGRSQVEQRDRKGIGMAVGPGGVSSGVRHHVVFDVDAARGEQFDRVDLFPKQGYRMFRYREDAAGKARLDCEKLPLGMWLGISGAAFSTGVGSRTSMGMSFLTGFGNVRLGYWWDAGVETVERLGPLALLFRGLFPVQNYLLDEFTARFPGSARRHWYLTDGGHFENLAGYELIRRRLPFIVLVDAEGDPQYTFGGLSGLVRKARLDFGAEIDFLTREELEATLDPAVLPYFGTLEMLRRGKWVEERRPNLAEPKRTRDAPDPVDSTRISLAHASLARVFYDGDHLKDPRPEPGSWLLYLKPTVRGDEPLDVLQYHGDNSDFPQQTTADQFFDEAQWESYRRLGEHIALTVFQAARTPGAGGWAPRSFQRP